MNKKAMFLSCLAALAPTPALAQTAQTQAVLAVCPRPIAPEQPTEEAGRDELLSAKAAVRRFSKEINIYVACLNKQALEYSDDVSAENQALTRAHNEAVQTLSAVVEHFNTAVRTLETRVESRESATFD